LLKRAFSGLFPVNILKYQKNLLHSCSKITDKGVEHLKGGLKTLKPLRHLSLGFGGSLMAHGKITDVGVNHLIESFSTLPITSLDLNLSL